MVKKNEYVWFGPHGAETKVLVKRKIDNNLGMILRFPTLEHFPITSGKDETVDKMDGYKRIFDRTLPYIHAKFKDDFPTYKEMCPVARGIYDGSTRLISFLKGEKIKMQCNQMRDLFCLSMQADDSYRFLFQALLTLIEWDKVKLTAPDLFWLKTKIWFDFEKYLEFMKQKGKLHK